MFEVGTFGEFWIVLEGCCFGRFGKMIYLIHVRCDGVRFSPRDLFFLRHLQDVNDLKVQEDITLSVTLQVLSSNFS